MDMDCARCGERFQRRRRPARMRAATRREERQLWRAREREAGAWG